jgi:hypothetical protein
LYLCIYGTYVCTYSIYGREDQELRDGEEKRGRCKTREREEGEMRDKGEGREEELVMKERRRRETGERGGGD